MRPSWPTGFPIRHFIDHGAYSGRAAAKPLRGLLSYLQVRAKAHASVPKPGEKIPVAGLDVEVVSSAGDLLKTP